MRTLDLPLFPTGPGTKAVDPLQVRVMPRTMHPHPRTPLVRLISLLKTTFSLRRLSVILRRRPLISTFTCPTADSTLLCRLRFVLTGPMGKHLFPRGVWRVAPFTLHLALAP